MTGQVKSGPEHENSVREMVECGLNLLSKKENLLAPSQGLETGLRQYLIHYITTERVHKIKTIT